jgi:hypothetical protein
VCSSAAVDVDRRHNPRQIGVEIEGAKNCEEDNLVLLNAAIVLARIFKADSGSTLRLAQCCFAIYRNR